MKSGGNTDDKDRFVKTVGIVLVATMIISVVTSIWFGWKIRSGLTDLDQEVVLGRKLEEKYQSLDVLRKGLLARDMIEKKASVLGLRSPVAKQIVRP